MRSQHTASDRDYSVDPSYKQARLEWARSLDSTHLNAFVADYLRGDQSESALDAYEEYKRRFPQSKRKFKPESQTLG